MGGMEGNFEIEKETNEVEEVDNDIVENPQEELTTIIERININVPKHYQNANNSHRVNPYDLGSLPSILQRHKSAK